MNETEKLARFIVETRLEEVPQEVFLAAKRAIMDTVGVILGAVPDPVGQSIIRYVREMSDSGQVTVLGGNLKTSPPWAALANGTLGHALDFDDSNWLLNGHASVGVLPAVLAQGEVQGASGKEVIEAFIIGFEISSKLGAGMNMDLYYNGWHPTCVLGAMGATAAVAHLRRFSLEQTRHALGCAASQASGVRANFGTMVKPLHAGLAAETGVRSAGLVAAGFLANPQILEARFGFCEAFSGAGKFRMDEITGPLGKPFVLESPGDNLKPYPCCMSSHISVDALRDLIEEENISAGDVEHIDVELLEPNYLNLSHHHPKTGLEGKFSAEYILSRVLLDGVLRLDTFTDSAVNDPAAQAMMEKIHVHLVEGVEWKHGTAKPAVVTVHARDGRVLKKRKDRSRGNAACPMTPEEVEGKFRDCAGRSLNPERLDEAINRLNRLEDETDVRSVISLLA